MVEEEGLAEGLLLEWQSNGWRGRLRPADNTQALFGVTTSFLLSLSLSLSLSTPRRWWQ
jgi:hypothetical protein